MEDETSHTLAIRLSNSEYTSEWRKLTEKEQVDVEKENDSKRCAHGYDRVCVNVAIGVLIVLCDLHVTRVLH